MDLKYLQTPFPAEDIEWRVGRSGISNSGKPFVMALAYLTSRAVMERLDQVCGPENWQNEYEAGPSGGIICGISIRVPRKDDSGNVFDHEWVTKWDGAENTQVEAIKGGLSDSMKRAAVQWGIGRYLYNLEATFADVAASSQPGWNFVKIDGKNFYWKPPQLPGWALPNS